MKTTALTLFILTCTACGAMPTATPTDDASTRVKGTSPMVVMPAQQVAPVADANTVTNPNTVDPNASAWPSTGTITCQFDITGKISGTYSVILKTDPRMGDSRDINVGFLDTYINVNQAYTEHLDMYLIRQSGGQALADAEAGKFAIHDGDTGTRMVTFTFDVTTMVVTIKVDDTDAHPGWSGQWESSNCAYHQ